MKILIADIVISLLNLELGFPLCFHSEMSAAAKVGLLFVFPVCVEPGTDFAFLVYHTAYFSGAHVLLQATQQDEDKSDVFHRRLLWSVQGQVEILVWTLSLDLGDCSALCC